MTRPRISALAASLILLIWILSGVTRVPADGGRFLVRRWIGGTARSVSPGWAFAPAGLARVVSFPRLVEGLVVRVGTGQEPPLRSPEGAALFAAGRLTLKPDPGKSEALASRFPAGWPATG